MYGLFYFQHLRLHKVCKWITVILLPLKSMVRLIELRTILLLLTLFPFFCASQELPPIQVYTPSEYIGENQNWDISQASSKFIYVANNHSLLEFDGELWRKYPSPNGSVIRSVTTVEEVIYTGCYMEFGFWQKNGLGNLEYTSISANLKEPLLDDEEFWNIEVIDGSIMFQSLNRIYIYNTATQDVRIIEAETVKPLVFYLKNKGIYFQRKDQGVFKIANNEIETVSVQEAVQNTPLVGIYELQNRLVFIRDDGRFLTEGPNGTLVPWRAVEVGDIEGLSLYSSLQLTDGSLILGSISDGIYHISEQGELIRKINQQQGLNNNTILNIYQDRDANLWLAHDNGLSVLNLTSPFNEFNDTAGKIGVVYTSAQHKGRLYLGTNQGLFVQQGDDSEFELIEGTEGQVWSLQVIDDTLFCGHNNGTYIVRGNQADLMANNSGTWGIKRIARDSNRLLQGNYNGISVLIKRGGQWELEGKLEGFNISSRFFEIMEDNKVIVSHEYKGLFTLTLDDGFQKIQTVEHQDGMGYATSLVTFNDQLLYATNNGVFSWNQSDQKFEWNNVFSNVFNTDGEGPMSILITDTQKERLWRFADYDILYVEPGELDGVPKLAKIAIPSFFRSNLGVSGFENINAIADDRYLIGTSNGYVTLDLDKVTTSDHQIHLNKISKEFYDRPSVEVPLDSIVDFTFKENNLLFTYSVPEYDKYTEVRYQYQLVGLYDKWSNWSFDAFTSFENLPFGDYEFKVRAMVGGELTENVASYAFNIDRPWYWSILAIVLYGLSFVALLFLTHKLYKRYYRKQQERILKENQRKLKRKKIKNQKKIVQIRNEKLEQEIEAKNRELAVSTMSLIKKNEFLNAIKDQLKQAEGQQAIRSVIRTIDRNINNEDDWKFFEEAFNNADKHFLKKIKELHPELTANDLRLCAYLRLNLSSKEIAPLLNISTRSVEVKRYRLRKKMDLPHEDGLVEYILSI